MRLLERDIEDYLCQTGRLEKHFGLTFIDRQIRIENFGILDILAYNKFTKCFVLIELKRDVLDATAYFQLERYGKAFSAKYHRKFQKLLVGKSLDALITHGVEYFDAGDHYRETTQYRLFNADLDKGVCFNYQSTHQENEADKICDLAIKGEQKEYIRWCYLTQAPNLPQDNIGIVMNSTEIAV